METSTDATASSVMMVDTYAEWVTYWRGQREWWRDHLAFPEAHFDAATQRIYQDALAFASAAVVTWAKEAWSEAERLTVHFDAARDSASAIAMAKHTAALVDALFAPKICPDCGDVEETVH